MFGEFLSYSLSPLRSGYVRAAALRLTLLVGAIASVCLATISPLHAQTLAIVHNFGDGTVTNDGQLPLAALVQGTDGNFYGTTQRGGSGGFGTVFKMTPAGDVTILHNFGGGGAIDDGEYPYAALVQGTDGNFYGTTSNGGSAGNGTAFQMTPAGAVIILHSFGDGTVTHDGVLPQSALVQGTDGNFYGTTPNGGSAQDGTVFKMTPAGAVTILHNFGDGTVADDGTYPEAALVQGADGNFYGTTQDNVDTNQGTVFKVTPVGIVTILHHFGDGTVINDGLNPSAALVQGTDGNFYGATQAGGSASVGTVFKMTPAGVLTPLVTNMGSQAALVLGSDGNFYGITEFTGSAADGSVFKMTPAGAVTILHNFGDGTVTNDGANPKAVLVQGADGSLYGTTEHGGSTVASDPNGFGYGTVFKLTVPGLKSASVWTARDAAAAPGGTARILWTRSDGAAGVWSMSASNVQTAVGPTYGPYAGWTAKAVSVAGDGTSRVLWTNTNGMAGVWTFNAQGTETVIGSTYGPYAGWTATDIATASNGTSRVLWTNTNGQTGIWTFSAADVETIIGATYGPYTGWTAKAVGAAGDGTARVLWTNTTGQAGVWSFNAANVKTIIGSTYGPYAGWSAADLGTSSDGTSDVLWKNVSGAAGVWTFNTADAETVIGATYGPYPGWTAAALDSANDQSRVLWVNTSRAAGLWSFNASDAESIIGPTYGPY